MKIVFSILMLFLTLSQVVGQVYLSVYDTDKVYVGPANIVSPFEGIKDMYLSIISQELEALKSVLDEIEALSNQKGLKRKQRRKLRQMKSSSHLIYEDLENLEILKLHWEGFDLFGTIDLHNLCFKNPSDQEYINMQTEEVSNYITIREFIDIKTTNLDEPKWVKKKAVSNCTSSNPDDCLVWCLISDSSIFVDMFGNIVDFDKDEVPFEFEYNKEDMRIYRQVDFELNGTVLSLKAVSLTTNEAIPFQKSDLVECD